MGIFNTKVFAEIQLKDYPTGKNIKCHFWLENNVTKEEAYNYVKNSLILSESYKDCVVHEIKIFNLLITNNKTSDENFGDIVLDSITNSYQSVVKKDKKVDIKDLNLKDYSESDIEYIRKKMAEELIMRRHNLLLTEFNFYKDNQKEINIEDTKEIYKKYNGDIYKLRKEKIRENLKNMIEKKVV